MADSFDHIIIGAGSGGLSLPRPAYDSGRRAKAYLRLGAQVTVIDRALLPRDKPQVSEVMCKVFAREGMDFIKALVTCARKDGDDTPP